MDVSSTDLDLLQGIWEQTCHEVDGIANPPDEYAAPGTLTTIAGNTFSVRRETGEILLHGIFELDASTSPKSITWIDSIGPDAGKRLPASYELECDAFTFIAADEGAPRPMAFRTSAGLTMRTFKRCSDHLLIPIPADRDSSAVSGNWCALRDGRRRRAKQRVDTMGRDERAVV